MSALTNRRIVITAGPTLETIDPVRFLSNHSSGKQGYAIAEALARRGGDVVLVSGPTCLTEPTGVTRIDVESARDMFEAVENALPADVFIAVAAVADWRPETTSRLKTDKTDAKSVLKLVQNPDILHAVSNRTNDRPALAVGFAAETHNVLNRARAKRLRKGCDWLLANDVSGDAMGGADNEVTLITETGETHWPRCAKSEIAEQLADALETALSKV